MTRPTLTIRVGVLLLMTAALVLATDNRALAQFTVTNLVTNVTDPNLKNAWGMAYASGGPFWVADEDTGVSTVYDANGTIVPLVVTIPSATTRKATPTGLVSNSTSGFVVSQNGVSGAAAFIFDTLDGTISGWSPTVNANTAVIAVNNKATANYTGLAIATVGTQTLLYAANQAKNQVEIYNSTFKLTKTFTDTTLTGLSVYGVSVLRGKVYVTFAGTGKGAVDVFSTGGKFVKTLIAPTATLSNPWGMAIAPSNFDTFGGDLLVGNVIGGRINGFNLTTGKLVGPLKDTTGAIIAIPGLWAIEFGGGSASNGNTNQLFFDAGGGTYATGAFGMIAP